MGGDRGLRAFVSEVHRNATVSDAAYDAAGASVRASPTYDAFLGFVDDLTEAMRGIGKPQQPTVCRNSPLVLNASAAKAKSDFDKAVQSSAAATSGSVVLGGLKKAQRSCENVLLDCGNDWSMPTDMVRASVIFEDLPALSCPAESHHDALRFRRASGEE
eukprot:TRINITY_DN1696_c0_g1_i1.p2 TRINITY_DN1696_c0_g1~~TRINITY_DN1696_c0_g1_i1.p2  ORF type:complete len:160 (+),score=34.71 TRINITY_DN1696_c0_g1_i1:553-1032(+)